MAIAMKSLTLPSPQLDADPAATIATELEMSLIATAVVASSAIVIACANNYSHPSAQWVQPHDY